MYLHIKRRRWTNKNTGEIVKRDWNLVAKVTRITQEFAAFFIKKSVIPINKGIPDLVRRKRLLRLYINPSKYKGYSII